MINYIYRLLDSLNALALPADEQLQHLKNLGGAQVVLGIDELALEYSDLVLLLDQHRNDLGIGSELANDLRRLDELLDSMSGAQNAVLWSPVALRESCDWKRVRELARKCSQKLLKHTGPSQSGPVEH